MKKRTLYIVVPVALLAIIYFIGPRPATPEYDKALPAVPAQPDELESYIATNEGNHQLKKDNQARIIWADSTKKKTTYSVVYLHGFSASQEEGNPVHMDFAKKFGCNLYLSRLSDHGIDTTEQLLYMTPDRLWASAKEALVIGKALGDKVILMSTSNGSTLSLMLAAEYPDDVFALLNMSPNIAINDGNAWLLNNPWGLQIARMVIGSDYRSFPKDEVKDQYWNNPYRIEAITQLQELLETKMHKDTFHKVKCPSLTLYYFKNEKEQDPTVKVSAIIEMNKELGTPEGMKVARSIPNAGAHVLGSHLTSKDIASVEREMDQFAVEKLKMRKVN